THFVRIGDDLRVARDRLSARPERRNVLPLALHDAKPLPVMNSTKRSAAALLGARGFAGLRYLTSSVLQAAQGNGRVERALVERADGRIETIDCERIACGYGLVPNTTLARALGCATLADGAIVVDGMMRTSVDGVFAAGECTGVGGMELAQIEGRLAGLGAMGAEQGERVAALRRERERWLRFAARVQTAFALGARARQLPADSTLLCRCEDVPIGAVRAHTNWRDAKLHTRCAMGACQGRVCGGAAQVLFGWDVAQVRPPIHPARIGTLMLGDDDCLAP
ncbi:FAD-dependent oxidoreductase, partial [Paraburkholderia bengalensis]